MPTPRRPGETEEQYTARVNDAHRALFDGRTARYIEQQAALGSIRQVKMRRGQDPFDALAEQHPDVIERWAAEIAEPVARIIAAKKGTR